MLVEPDAQDAAEDRTELLDRMRAVLERVEVEPPPADVLRHPAAVEAVHTAGRLWSGPLEPDRRQTLADLFAELPAAAFGPAEPRGHLRRSVARALRAVPARTGPDGLPVAVEVAEWRAAERETLAEAVALLTRVWPESAAETEQTVAEIALLDGNAIDGFTDFTVHGAVLINRVRLQPSPTGLPGPVRFAEALVHEGAHTRCNAAALTGAFLLPDGSWTTNGSGTSSSSPSHTSSASSGELLVATPLRADPRPLTGLFQQAVVLARSVHFYRRLSGLESAAVDARRQRLLDSGRQAVDTLAAHAGALTGRGREVLEQCADVVRAQA
ncbi:MAG TPA: HEXXH motif-containing putative peptide modification protein [Streptomyces sp.]|nr:HEXXH motif-containing putative peptide modification protein [Streptomyces sp.]